VPEVHEPEPEPEPEPDPFTTGISAQHARIAAQVRELIGEMRSADVDAILTDAGVIGVKPAEWSRPQWVAVRAVASDFIEAAVARNARTSEPDPAEYNWAAEVEREAAEIAANSQ
jgi:hypothetical protein